MAPKYFITERGNRLINDLLLPLVPFLAKPRFHSSGSGNTLITTDSAALADCRFFTQKAQRYLQGLCDLTSQACTVLNLLIFQAPPESPTELLTLDGFSRPKTFHVPSPKTCSGLSHQYPTALEPISALLWVSIVPMKHDDQKRVGEEASVWLTLKEARIRPQTKQETGGKG